MRLSLPRGSYYRRGNLSSKRPLTLPSPAKGEGFLIPIPRREGSGEGDNWLKSVILMPLGRQPPPPTPVSLNLHSQFDSYENASSQRRGAFSWCHGCAKLNRAQTSRTARPWHQGTNASSIFMLSCSSLAMGVGTSCHMRDPLTDSTSTFPLSGTLLEISMVPKGTS